MLSIYKASAGSGKTYRLTERYITLLLTTRNPESGGGLRLVAPGTRGRHRHILAITFTNKATEEMKRRIVHELGVLSGMEKGWEGKSPYLDALMLATGATEEQIADRSATALRDLLNDFGQFNVSTIDSFFQSVLRTFAREAELPGNYEVDLDQESAIRLGIDEMLKSVNSAEWIGSPEERADSLRLEHWLTELMTDLMRKGKGFNLFNRNTDVHRAVVAFMKAVMDDTYAAHSSEIDAYLADPARLQGLTAALRNHIEQLQANARTACAVAARLDGLNKNTLAYFRMGAEKGFAVTSAGAFPKTITNITENPAKAFLAKSRHTEADDLAALAAANALTEAARTGLYADIIHQLYVLGLMGRINAHIARFRSESSTLLLSDTNSILRRIIGDDDTPFIYERTGRWIHHFLIDEFQDTSQLQWLNLLPLIRESLAGGHDNLIIGDEKQSIYRFRGSDPTLLMDLEDTMASDAVREGNNAEGNTNWRSAASIVRFNNTFFRTLAALEGEGSILGRIYGNVTQRVAKTSLPGYILFEPYTPPPAPGEKAPLAEQERQSAFANTINHISRQISNGYRPGDIAVLFRKGKDSAAFIEQLLNRVETDPDYPRLKVMSDESLYVSRSRAVRLVISVLRILAARNTSASSRHLSDRRSAELLSRYEQSIASGAATDEALADVIREFESPEPSQLADELTRLECATLEALISRVIECYVSDEMRESQSVYLSALVDLAIEQANKGMTDLRTFLQWWDDKGHLSAIPATAHPDAVRVMTIHKSKGLEFPCVHIPFSDGKEPPEGVRWFTPAELDFVDPALVPPLLPLVPVNALADTDFAPQLEQMLVEKQIDNTNVVYVAFTRAVRELIVGYRSGGNGPFSEMVTDVLDQAEAPGFIESLAAQLSPEAGEVYLPLRRDAAGRLEIGEPTSPVSKAGPRTLLDPTDTIVVSAPGCRGAAIVWDNVRLDDDCEPLLPSSGGIEVQRRVMAMAMRTILSPADIPKAVGRLVDGGRIPLSEAQAMTALLVDRVSGPATAHWFSGYRRAAVGRTVSTGNRGGVTADRLIWTADGHLDVVQYLGEDMEAARTNARFLLRTLSRAGRGPVRAFIWDLVGGHVTAVER